VVSDFNLHALAAATRGAWKTLKRSTHAQRNATLAALADTPARTHRRHRRRQCAPILPPQPTPASMSRCSTGCVSMHRASRR
jgi:hypothetical protein